MKPRWLTKRLYQPQKSFTLMIALLLISLAAFGYLLYAIVHPEKF